MMGWDGDRMMGMRMGMGMGMGMGTGMGMGMGKIRMCMHRWKEGKGIVESGEKNLIDSRLIVIILCNV